MTKPKGEVEARQLAEEHWRFLEKWLHLVFVDGFVHGWKHALELEDVRGK